MAGRNVEFVTTIPGRYALSVNDAGMPTPKGLGMDAADRCGSIRERSYPESQPL
jgi:hypothetical protein